ncbi:hypothetical protein OBP_190 [Pseudomonas phage OBP]|uniref:hypothetical protein n=1 Tax=Pseudomonas phage OBP TaxID=1124849 RepID=UPI000240D59E|nr:hypothetical protein OBP_190 [Pseudomonas phage OBP]AEV89627.1 hypothetical protein OBP_190 [Pseudomonas phage OBP]
MTLNEHKKEVEALLAHAKRYGDYQGITEHEQLLSDLEKLTESEYASYIKVRKMFGANSVKPIVRIPNANGT